jgi:hypothetical protein
MRPHWLSPLAAIGLLALSGGAARAQTTPYRPGSIMPYTQPAYSPYLNLLRPGNPFFTNYYGLVRPEVEFRSGIRGLQQQTAAEQEAITGLAGGGLPATGHRTTFLSTGNYFLSRTGATSAAGARPQTPQMGAAPTTQPNAPRR